MLPILYQDDHIAVLNKPAGLPVHAGPRGGPSVEDWFAFLPRHRAGPWLAHRLDADTAGCLVVALRRPALLAAQRLFATGGADKTYWALVQGRPAAPTGRLALPLAKRNSQGGWRMVPDPAAPAAITDWRVCGAWADQTWLELKPRTGRTHQIRAHCAALGCPILGDPVYGARQAAAPLQLLARAIRLPLDPPLCATAPAPPHMADLLRRCGAPDCSQGA